MSLQEIIVIAIIFFCIYFIVFRLYRFFRSAKNNENPCANCKSGCDLKRIMDQKKKQCSQENKDNLKNTAQ